GRLSSRPGATLPGRPGRRPARTPTPGAGWVALPGRYGRVRPPDLMNPGSGRAMRVERAPEGVLVDVASGDEAQRLARGVAGGVGPGTVVGLVGPLGSGKTRLVRAIAGALGVDRAEVVSPTFVLIHEYQGRLPVFHFDAYRLGGPEPFEAL